VISYAAYHALSDLYPSEVTLFKDLMTSLGYDPANTLTGTSTPSGIGNLAAQAVIAFRHGDGSNQLGDLHPGAYSDYTGYVPVNDSDHINDPNHWQPLRVSDGHGGFVTQQYIAPQWGLVTPFALSSGAQFRPWMALRRFPLVGAWNRRCKFLITVLTSLIRKRSLLNTGPMVLHPNYHLVAGACLPSSFRGAMLITWMTM